MKKHAVSFRTFVLGLTECRKTASKLEDEPSCYQDTMAAFRPAVYSARLEAKRMTYYFLCTCAECDIPPSTTSIREIVIMIYD